MTVTGLIRVGDAQTSGGLTGFRRKTSASKVYGGSFDAHPMHNVCTTHMPGKRVGIESLMQARGIQAEAV